MIWNGLEESARAGTRRLAETLSPNPEVFRRLKSSDGPHAAYIPISFGGENRITNGPHLIRSEDGQLVRLRFCRYHEAVTSTAMSSCCPAHAKNR